MTTFTFTQVNLLPGWVDSSSQTQELMDWLGITDRDSLNEFFNELYSVADHTLNWSGEFTFCGQNFRVTSRSERPVHSSERSRQRITIRRLG